MWDAGFRQKSPEQKGFVRIHDENPLDSLGRKAGLDFGDFAWLAQYGHIVQEPCQRPVGSFEFLVSPLVAIAALKAHGNLGRFEAKQGDLEGIQRVYPEFAKLLAAHGTQRSQAMAILQGAAEDAGLAYVKGYRPILAFLKRNG